MLKLTLLQIQYDDIWQVPVCYFRISDQSGSLVMLSDELLANFINGAKEKGVASSVSLKPHPTFMVPFYEVHPCGTHELIKQLKVLENQKSVVYLFLSILQEMLHGIKLL